MRAIVLWRKTSGVLLESGALTIELPQRKATGRNRTFYFRIKFRSNANTHYHKVLPTGFEPVSSGRKPEILNRLDDRSKITKKTRRDAPKRFRNRTYAPMRDNQPGEVTRTLTIVKICSPLAAGDKWSGSND